MSYRINFLLPFVLTLQVWANPMLSYLDDTELGAGKTSIVGMIFNIIVWGGLFYYWVLHERIQKWKERQKAKRNFTVLVERLYRIDKELGGCFERNVTFIHFSKKTLYWNSYAEGYDKKILNKHGMLIIDHIRYVFGQETKINNEHAKKDTGWKEKWKARKQRKAEEKRAKVDNQEDDSIMNIVVIVVFIVAGIGARLFFEG